MIVGSGLIARALIDGGADAIEGTCFLAAGVSNSGCTDQREYLREHARLDAVLAACPAGTQIVYFSTCSIEDPAARDSEYVKHKIRMEGRIRERPRYLILRLPQVAGSAPNPHTLLNFLHARITRSERFHVWRGATRNVIDVEDVVKIALDLIVREGANAETINVASPHSSTILDIVRIMERALGVHAVCEIVDKGSAVPIETSRVASSARRCAIAFDSGYLGGVIEKYYGAPIREIEALTGSSSRIRTIPVPSWQV